MAPTSEKSNMMTCELDLSQHMPASKNSSLMHKRVFSGGYIHNKISRTLMPQNNNNQHSKVMSTQNTTS